MDTRLRGEIFEGLKRALKARGMTYADLAKAMDLSEPTIKRIFSEADCKMMRLLTICDVIDVALSDLLERAERTQPRVIELSYRVEAELASDRTLFFILLLMRNEATDEEAQRYFDLSPATFFSYMRRLEKLGLAYAAADGSLRVNGEVPMRFHRDGPLRQFVKDLNTIFLIDRYDEADGEDRLFLNASRRMLPETAILLRKDINALMEKMSKLSRQDQLLNPADKLRSYKVSGAFGPFDYPDFLTAMHKINFRDGDGDI